MHHTGNEKECAFIDMYTFTIHLLIRGKSILACVMLRSAKTCAHQYIGSLIVCSIHDYVQC
jgi:hypothetical protein